MVLIRPATEPDLDAVVGLRRLMFVAMGTAPEVPEDPVWAAAARTYLAQRLGRRNCA